MQSLLRWGIENSAADGPPPQSVDAKKLDPGVIDMILGKPDAVLMKEALAIAKDESRDEDDRVQALDDFEMLVESIDNANDLEKLNMWQPLHDLLVSPSTTDQIKTQTIWVLGTAVQNNPSAQYAYLKLSPLPTLLTYLSPSTTTSAKLRSKAVYALSGLLKHNASAVAQLDAAGGWPILRDALEDSDIGVRRKIAFLLNALLIPSASSSAGPSTGSTSAQLHTGAPPNATVHPNSHASMLADPSSTDTSPPTARAMTEHALVDKLVSAVASPVPHGPDGEQEGDDDFEENVIATLHTYAVSCGGTFTDGQKQELRGYLGREKATTWGLTAEELSRLKATVE